MKTYTAFFFDRDTDDLLHEVTDTYPKIVAYINTHPIDEDDEYVNIHENITTEK